MTEILFNKRDQYGVAAGICAFIIMIGFIISYTVYFCYSIYALSQVSDKTIRNTCEDSILWRYVLVSIIVPFALGNTSKNKEKETPSNRPTCSNRPTLWENAFVPPWDDCCRDDYGAAGTLDETGGCTAQHVQSI